MTLQMKSITNHQILNTQTRKPNALFCSFLLGLQSIKVLHNGRENISKGQVMIHVSLSSTKFVPVRELCSNFTVQCVGEGEKKGFCSPRFQSPTQVGCQQDDTRLNHLPQSAFSEDFPPGGHGIFSHTSWDKSYNHEKQPKVLIIWEVVYFKDFLSRELFCKIKQITYFSLVNYNSHWHNKHMITNLLEFYSHKSS